MGGTWSAQGVIVFATLGDPLKRVSDSGGTPEHISGIAVASDAVSHLWPTFLPDGKHFLYVEWRYATPESHANTVWIGSLDGENARRLPLASTNAAYSDGYLVFSQDGDLLAQRFDLARLKLSGPALPVARNVQYDTFFDAAAFTISSNGTLVYAAAGTGIDSELTWMDRSGKALGVLGEPGHFEEQAIAPDAKRVAVNVKPSGPREQIWIYDVDRGTRVPLDPATTGPVEYSPHWSPDGTQVAYRLTEGKTSGLFVRAADGSGNERQIGSKSDGVFTLYDWSRDGHYMVATLTKFMGGDNWHDILQVVPAEGEAKPAMEIENASDGKISPDGRWLAYADDNTGEIYVTPFPGPGARIAVSSKGGYDLVWRGDGQELFYVANDQALTAVQVRESVRDFHVISSEPLFRLQLPGNVGFYDVTRDGKRFLVNTRTYKEQSAPLTVLTNWTAQVQNDSRREGSKN
jgi:hypothetical protein